MTVSRRSFLCTSRRGDRNFTLPGAPSRRHSQDSGNRCFVPYESSEIYWCWGSRKRSRPRHSFLGFPSEHVCALRASANAPWLSKQNFKHLTLQQWLWILLKDRRFGSRTYILPMFIIRVERSKLSLFHLVRFWDRWFIESQNKWLNLVLCF